MALALNSCARCSFANAPLTLFDDGKQEVLSIGTNGDPNGFELEPDITGFAGIQFIEGSNADRRCGVVHQSSETSGI